LNDMIQNQMMNFNSNYMGQNNMNHMNQMNQMNQNPQNNNKNQS
jgi:hypothetical protein